MDVFMAEGNKKMARTSITIPEDDLEWFKDYCQQQRRSVSAQVQYWIESAKAKSKGKGQGDEDA